MIDKSEVRIERLEHPWPTAFLGFADRATLDSLASVRIAQHLAPGQTMLCALHRGQVIGCTSWYQEYRHTYVALDGTTARAIGVYLCSSEVLPRFRGMGIGSMLYEHRLTECGGDTPGVSVEILGQGSPLSVDEEARPGLVWHLVRGFAIVGYSCAADAGPVLTR
ncbi:GNAT family N-acetyltransferase [Streptomyces fuscichromogenes]|uniref:GNAT family N-acetyltransferase n=1 Tax=Streptomyces fuscichromogenes TaxID=1324013 RepID=UPI001670CFE2|nr:GNAT family N-acetyltransferase [Streptomyces fuscichromogenes]